MKRAFDAVAAAVGLLVVSPLLLAIILLIWLQDCHHPFYVAPRVGRGGRTFKMVKLRSMVVNADRAGGDSTSATDSRITTIGKIVRRTKLDEVMQLWNVLLGDMSLVGPRPNVKRETDLYTAEERRMLEIKPGITDFASIVFADEGDILSDSADPDLDYAQLIRPWKSRLGLLYLERRSLFLDINLIALTLLGILSRRKALDAVVRKLERLGASSDLIDVSARTRPLRPAPPPGSDTIVTSRAA